MAISCLFDHWVDLNAEEIVAIKNDELQIDRDQQDACIKEKHY